MGLALVSLLGAGWFAYSQQQAQQKVRATIAEKVAAAQRCFAEENFDCAIEHSLVATNLDPENVIARQLLLSAQRANEQRASDEKINELIAEAKTCLQQQDLDCAALFLQKAEAIGAHSSQVVSFHEALSVARAQQAQTAAKKKQEISSALARAQTCLSGRDYSCVVNSADRILELDPTNAQAVAIKQSASLAQEQASALTVKITRLMSDAQACMDKKNYSCAIAKAESVLELDASYQAAVALKNRAQETQRKLKESGFTIK